MISKEQIREELKEEIKEELLNTFGFGVNTTNPSKIHIYQNGDSLLHLANSNRLRMIDIVKANPGIKGRIAIPVGFKLNIPEPFAV